MNSQISPTTIKKKLHHSSASARKMLEEGKDANFYKNATLKLVTDFIKKHQDDPYSAFTRDIHCAYDPTFDENSTKLIYNLHYQNLRTLIDHQRRVRKFLESQIADWEVKYKSCWQELENEKIKSAKYERDKMISLIDQLEKEKESLKQEVVNVKSDLEKEKEREKSMVMCLVTERKQLICRLIEHEQHNNALIDMLTAEQCRSAEMSEDLEEESKRSLQMESELERLTASYEKSKVLLLDKINSLENKSTKLEEENDKLKKELEAIKSKRIAQLGEGVRSTIVTVNSSDHKVVPSVTSSVAAQNQPKLNARPVSPSRVLIATSVAASGSSSSVAAITSSGAASSPRSTVAGQVSTVSSSSIQATTSSSSSSSATSTYAVIQPISKTGTNHATTMPINPITSTPPTATPPSKNSTTAQTATAFQNMTYNMDTTTPPSKSSNVTSQSINTTTATPPSSNRTVTPGKVMVASGSPQAPVQKKLSTGPVAGTGSGTSPVFRGAPPPIPPNKPILPANALKERSKEIQQATVRAKLMTAKPITTPLSTSPSTPVPVQGEPIVNDKSPSSSSKLSPSVMVNGTIKRKDKSSKSSIKSSKSTVDTNQVPKKVNPTINSDTNNQLNDTNSTTTTTNNNINSLNHISNNDSKPAIDSETSTHVEMISKEIADFQKLLGSMVAKTLKDKQLF